MSGDLMTMETVTTGAALADRISRLRARGERVVFVPTMGALHDGHLGLVQRARELGDRVVVSIFVNPTQFDDAADLAAYPRTIDEDSELLALHGCDVLFLPSVEEMYPSGFSTTVDVEGPSSGLEGAHRPGHFAGVATVVTKLLMLVRPDCALFGEKDAQQLAVVRRLADDLHLGVEIASLPTVRESDGLAMSSRNVRLSPEEREAATILYRALDSARALIEGGEDSADAIREHLRATVESEPRARLEYAEVVDADTFRPVDEIAGVVVLPIAAYVGSTRLIDNVRVQSPASDEAPAVPFETESVDPQISEN